MDLIPGLVPRVCGHACNHLQNQADDLGVLPEFIQLPRSESLTPRTFNRTQPIFI